MATLAPRQGVDWSVVVRSHWLLVVGALSLLVPTVYSMARGPWSVESGVHGPIVLATGLWLIYGRIDEIREHMRPGAGWLTGLGIVVAICLYGFGRAFDFISIEVAGMLLALLSVAHAYLGLEVLKRLWFPIFYLGFIIPLPNWFLDVVTQPLKLFVSEIVTGALSSFGYPMGRQGVTIFVSTYQLLVEDACAGLNSLVSLSAIGLFYVYMLRGSNWRYSLLLLALVLPVAIGANIVRVAALVLITYYMGNAAAQGYLHNFAGMVTFVSALLLIFLVDKILTPVRNALARMETRQEGRTA
ncbi:exosortase [Polymorphobacter multimanifer]|uniref:Exosortase n=2 Tax=Polymorphobacter multimanifer TaxID=1070431 RepID=A0A841KZ87_9SPHN|nr:exosortase V [Polymorphobacter multimanifer]MBB6225869.1 exosortase [Polymorphobacter multimanifer]